MSKHKIILPDGREISSGDQGTAIISVSVTESVNAGTDLTLGSTCAASLELKLFVPEGEAPLHAGDEVALYEDGVLLGLFTLEKPTRTGVNQMSVTAYDRVSWLDKELAPWLSGLSAWPYRLDTFARLVCDQCGVTLTGDIPNGDYLITEFTAGEVTGRQLIGWVAEAAGCFCRARPDGVLELAWYRETDIQIGPAGPIFYYQGSLSFEEYRVKPVERVRVQLTEDDVGVVYPLMEGDANTYFVTGNYLLTTDSTEALEPVARGLFERLDGFTYTPCTLTVPASCNVRAGDILTVTDRSGREFRTIVMTRTHAGGKDTLESTGGPDRTSAEALNNSGYRALSGKVFEIRKSIEGLLARAAALENEENISRERLAELEMTARGLEISVSQAEQLHNRQLETINTQLTSLQLAADGLSLSVQEILQNGVDSVTTKTGYTFNADGLTIHKEGEEIHNTVDNTGMYVKRGDETMLRAGADGVVATDVTVRNFLIVGEHARFEAYPTNRVACFYV